MSHNTTVVDKGQPGQTFLGAILNPLFFYSHSDAAKFPRQMFSDDVQQVPKGGPPPSGPLALVLNSEENMFMEMRDLNFRAVGVFLSREAKKITQEYEVCVA